MTQFTRMDDRMIATEQFQQAVDMINGAHRVLITSHTKPDGDACGCVAAMAEVLRTLGKQVDTLFLSPVPAWYQFLLAEPVLVLGREVSDRDLVEGRLGPYDLVILVDVGSVSQLPKFTEYLKVVRPPVLVIDHHVTSDNRAPWWCWIPRLQLRG
jgi:phosphoesterase RecJ-like protein